MHNAVDNVIIIIGISSLLLSYQSNEFILKTGIDQFLIVLKWVLISRSY